MPLCVCLRKSYRSSSPSPLSAASPARMAGYGDMLRWDAMGWDEDMRNMSELMRGPYGLCVAALIGPLYLLACWAIAALVERGLDYFDRHD